MPFAALPPGLAAGNIKRHWEINQAHTRRQRRRRQRWPAQLACGTYNCINLCVKATEIKNNNM